MNEWTIRVFVDENRRSDFLQWRAELPPKVRARMHAIITYMKGRKDWTQTPYFTPLKGYTGIGEIKFTVQDIQYRPLGCYGPKEGQYTLLVGAKEKGDEFVPKSAPDIAVKRRELVLKDERYTYDYY